MKKYLIGIDVGTSGTKSVLFNTFGEAIASATVEYPMYQPKNGWAEQNPDDWWRAAVSTIKSITKGINKDEIAGIGLTGQMHSLVMLDGDNRVIRPAILWCDGRTDAECQEIDKRVGRERLLALTANPALPGFSAPKLLWVRNNEPENYAKCRHILIAKDYIRYRLTGEFATDMSDASGTSLLNVKERKWCDEIIDSLEIDKTILPKLYESPEVSGYVNEEAAEITGLPIGVPVAAGAGDNAASAIGCGVAENGEAFTTIGTSGVVFVHTDKPKIDFNGRIHTFCAAVPGKWHVMGVTQAAGLSLNWFRHNFAENISYGDLDSGASEIPCGSDRLIYLPYLMGERTPILDTNARGIFFGLSAIHSKYHLARAVMEGVTYSLTDCLSVIREVGIDIKNMALCGGGGKSALWRSMVSDAFAMPVCTMFNEEGPAMGAAILAGCAAGVYDNVKDGCLSAVKTKSTTHPCEENTAIYLKYYELYKSLYAALKDEYSKLKEI